MNPTLVSELRTCVRSRALLATPMARVRPVGGAAECGEYIYTFNSQTGAGLGPYKHEK